MSSNEPESPGGWVVDLRNPEALRRALESAGGMPPRKGRKRKDPTPTGTTRPSTASAEAAAAPTDPSAAPHDPLPTDDQELTDDLTAPGRDHDDDEEEDDGDGPVRTTSGVLPSRSAAEESAGGPTRSAGDGSTGDGRPPARHGDESLIAQAQLPVSLEQQRRRRQWAIGGTAAVAVVACVLVINGLRDSGGSSTNGASLPDITVPTAPASQATTLPSAAPSTTAGTPTTATTAVDPLTDITTIRNAPPQFGFFLDGEIVLQGTVPSKSKGADMNRAAGDLVGNERVNAAYAVDDTAATVPHPPLYIANPIRFDNKGNLDADSEQALKDAAQLMIATPEARMAVLGFTSAQGSASDNLKLSQQKAGAVAAELVRLGVPLDQLFVEGRGETDPLGDNTTVAGRTANDRVELVAQGLLG